VLVRLTLVLLALQLEYQRAQLSLASPLLRCCIAPDHSPVALSWHSFAHASFLAVNLIWLDLSVK
jgi:hypothetical protein